MAKVDQMTSANGASVFVVDRDRIGVQIASHAVRDHVRRLGGLNKFPPGKIVRTRNDDQSRWAPGEDRLQPGSFHRLFTVGTGDDDLVTILAEGLFDCGDNRREERVVEIGNEDSDDLRLSRPQHRSERIGAIVERFHRGFDPFDEIGAHRLSASQYVRDRSRRDAGHFSHIIDRTHLFDHHT